MDFAHSWLKKRFRTKTHVKSTKILKDILCRHPPTQKGTTAYRYQKSERERDRAQGRA
jgi:hypothetical protein